MPFWKKIRTIELFKHSRISLVEDTVELPNGKETQYLRYESLPDYATIIVRADGNIAFIREYSYPLDQFLLQFPEGSIELGESALMCARRELKEEAGLASTTIQELTNSPADHRRSTVWQHVMLAEEAYEVEKTGGDTEEQGTETVWVPEAEVDQLIATGKLMQRNALAAWAIYRASFHNT